jgi:hypothetical protein
LIFTIATGHFDALPEKFDCQEAINPSPGHSPAAKRNLMYEKPGRFAD